MAVRRRSGDVIQPCVCEAVSPQSDNRHAVKVSGKRWILLSRLLQVTGVNGRDSLKRALVSCASLWSLTLNAVFISGRD